MGCLRKANESCGWDGDRMKEVGASVGRENEEKERGNRLPTPQSFSERSLENYNLEGKLVLLYHLKKNGNAPNKKVCYQPLSFSMKKCMEELWTT